MKQIWITRYGGPEVLEVRDVSLPPLRENEVTVGVRAAGFNFADLMAMKGLYPDAPKPPCVVGYEISGVVEELGPGVPPSWIGKEVIAFTRFGGYSEKVNLSVNQIFETPESLTLEEGAALPVNYLTAYQLVKVMGSLNKGETILIHNVGGGVGLAALQYARGVGAVTMGTASSGKHEFLKKQGLQHPIDYRKKDWEKQVLDLTGGKGVDLILDPVGGANWKKNYRLLRSTGRLGMFGVSSASEGKAGKILSLLGLAVRIPLFNPVALMNQNRGVFGVNLGHLWHEPEKVRGWMEEILEDAGQGRIKPIVDRTFRFSEAAEAFRFVEERRNIGKVLLVP